MFVGDVVVREDNDDPKFWILESELVYEGDRIRSSSTRSSRPTSSVPRLFVWFLPRYGRYTRAAILHDHLWDDAKAGRIVWRDADGIFRRAMRELGVPLLRRWIMWTAVRWGALADVREGSLAGWWRDLPQVLLCTLIALPIVAPPAVLILIALTLFYVYELIAFVALKAGRGLRRAFGAEPSKKLNRPVYSLKTG